MPSPISLSLSSVFRLPRDFTVGGKQIGEATPASSTSQPQPQEMPAPKAFTNPLELIGWLRAQSVRDVLAAIGIGAKDGGDHSFDGKMLDPVKPTGGTANPRKLLEVNGINTPLDVQKSNIQFLADKTGREVVGIHNASGGLMEDAMQFLNDKWVRCNNPAVNTVRDTVLDAVKKGEPIDLVCHSQGAIITERALCEAQSELKDELRPATYARFLGPDWERISKKAFPDVRETRLLKMAKMQLNEQVENMFSNVRVESFGGAARLWPDGPKYVHHVNVCDPVPGLFGMTFVVPPTHPGKGAVIHQIQENHPTDKHGADGIDASVHGPEQVYFKHTTSYEAALAEAKSGTKGWKVYDA